MAGTEQRLTEFYEKEVEPCLIGSRSLLEPQLSPHLVWPWFVSFRVVGMITSRIPYDLMEPMKEKLKQASSRYKKSRRIVAQMLGHEPTREEWANLNGEALFSGILWEPAEAQLALSHLLASSSDAICRIYGEEAYTAFCEGTLKSIDRYATQPLIPVSATRVGDVVKEVFHGNDRGYAWLKLVKAILKRAKQKEYWACREIVLGDDIEVLRDFHPSSSPWSLECPASHAQFCTELEKSAAPYVCERNGDELALFESVLTQVLSGRVNASAARIPPNSFSVWISAVDIGRAANPAELDEHIWQLLLKLLAKLWDEGSGKEPWMAFLRILFPLMDWCVFSRVLDADTGNVRSQVNRGTNTLRKMMEEDPELPVLDFLLWLAGSNRNQRATQRAWAIKAFLEDKGKEPRRS